MSAKQDSSQESSPANITVFPVERTHVLAAAVMFCIIGVGVSTAPVFLWWIALLPLVFAWWAWNSKTIIDDRGIRTINAFGRNAAITWEKFTGLRFKKSRTYAVSTDGTEYSMPGVSFSQLPALAEASHGRIPDAITQAHEAMNGNMVIYSQDGHSRMMTKEEYAAEHERLKQEVKQKLATRAAQEHVSPEPSSPAETDTAPKPAET
ncbi:MAG: PH domain-containing protein [Corynebacterium sp.]|nr:PH domain-containing protein [Corynebacterium sp.]